MTGLVPPEVEDDLRGFVIEVTALQIHSETVRVYWFISC